MLAIGQTSWRSPASWGVALALLIGALLSACQPAPATLEARPSQAAQSPPAGSELVIYNWDTYIDPAVLAGFERKFGATISYTTYSNNEELMATIQARPGVYDIVVPSDYAVAMMREQGQLAPLDKTHLPNFENLDPAFTNPAFDPGNRYCVPYLWGTGGIGYRLGAVAQPIQSWQDFFNPAYAGRVAMLDDPRSSIGVALLYLGHSPNTTNPAEILAARDFLLGQSRHIATYAPDTGQDLLLAGQVDLAFEWSGDIFQAMEKDAGIRYVVPLEGSFVWVDNVCIPAGAPHHALAEQFINYVLEPGVGAALANFTHFASPNQAALPAIHAEDRDNPALYPPPEVRTRLFLMTALRPEIDALYVEAWADIMAERHR